MWLFNYFRIYICAGAAIAFSIGFKQPWWLGLLLAIVCRVVWYIIEKEFTKRKINRLFEHHSYEFKQQFGPYGIRLINKAEEDWSVKKSLSEVFECDLKKLQETVSQLESIDILFKAGLQPQGDIYQLHDLKLKYGKYRLAKIEKK
jgi:hypothetical protein